MDNILKDTADLLDWIDTRLKTHQDNLQEREWADFNEIYRKIHSRVQQQNLKIDELIRWD